ncbi:unnamed protein product [Rotaria magnacalcarata]|uniref:F-box domain-containing protein n=1 Tax=Rotaria magnacalcarata TaxID=392030 RepID=A0A819RXX2_9BILA|nr:unnamed protein product [Rotaria magnacalcarata]CAF4060592.1 unnamed protein product [Rotaria magnacalcarata]
MFAVKPPLNNKQFLRKEEAEKYRIVINNDKKIISCIENLSNEIFYEIFDFLDGCEIYQAFSNLNSRFQTLITCSTLRLKIDLSTRPDSSLEYWSKYVVVPNKDRIIALSWPFSYDHDLGYTLFNIDSSFIRLEILTLRSIRAKDLIPLLINMISLPHLFSLTINYDEDPQEISNIYQASFNLSMLKYFKLSFFAFETLFSISINVDKQLTAIKYLVIDHCCSLDELIALFSCTPQLCRLTCEQVNESHKDIVKDTLCPILSLTRISIGRCYAKFNEIEIFLTKISSQLEELRFNSFSDVNYLDANRWERIISQYLQHLNIFEFQYNEIIERYSQTTIDYGRLNQFKSSFWIKQKWIFKISIDTDSSDKNVIVFSIFPDRKIRSNSYEKVKNDINFNDDVDQNMEQVYATTSSIMLAETNQLDIIDLSNSKYNESCFDRIGRIQAAVKITRLNIIASEMFMETLIEIIGCVPDIDSLVISSLEMVPIRCLSTEEAKTLRLLSVKNVITKVTLHQMNDLAPVKFLLHLCRRMKYLDVDCTKNVLPETFLRFILMHKIKHISRLSVLCLKIPETDIDIVDKLKGIIDIEQLCFDYKIEQIDNKIYLRLFA